MLKGKEYSNYLYLTGKLAILSVFVLAMVLLAPFFYGWINGMAHKDLCKFAKIKSVWSCGLIVREPGILGAYLQFRIGDQQAEPLPQEKPASTPSPAPQPTPAPSR